MLSWSSDKSDAEVDLRALGTRHGDTRVPLGSELLRFAQAAADTRAEPAEMTCARQALIAGGGRDLMVDAAAVAANFQMMTRLADGTGARYPEVRLDSMAGIIDQMGNAGMISRR